MAWKKIPAPPKGKKPPYYLEVYEGKYKTSYRVNLRAGGVRLREKLKGDYSTWQDALRDADELIAKARFGEKAKPKELFRSEDVCRTLIAESAGQSRKTIEGKENIFGKHLIPWLNENLPYAADLTVATWPAYKLHKRTVNSTIALENHVKYFRSFARRVFELGLIKQKVRIQFDVKKEDFREKGHVIPDEELTRMIAAANRNWRDRIIIQRDTGMRPGEVRDLRKDRVRFVERGGRWVAVVSLREQDTKTRRAREFEVHSERAVHALRWRAKEIEGPYFFPSRKDRQRPMDKHLTGWNNLLRRAGVSGDYTPHDLRHTYATQMFKKRRDVALLCYQLDMSLEVAQKTYIHFKATDTAALAEDVASYAASQETPDRFGDFPEDEE